MDRILQTLEATDGLLTVQRAAELLVHHPYKAIKARLALPPKSKKKKEEHSCS